VTRSGESLKVLAAQAARTISRAGRSLLSSEHPVSLAAEYKADVVNVSIDAARPTRVRLFLGGAPSAAKLDGGQVPPGGLNFDRADGTVSFVVPAGAHRLSFSLR
jgi:hypothetical protein